MAQLLIGTYTSAAAGGRAEGILAAVWDGASVTDVRTVLDVRDPSYLTVARDGCVYAVDETGGRLLAFTPDLAPLGEATTGGDAPCHLAVSPDGEWVLVAHYGSGSVSVHERRPDGTLGEQTAHVQQGAGGHAHMVLFDEVGGRVLVPDLGLDEVVSYELARGTLIEHGRLRFPDGTGPRHAVLHDQLLSVVGELGNTVTTFARDGDGWERIARVSTLPAGWDGHSQAAAIRVHRSRMYVSNRGHDSVAVFSLTPAPQPITHVPCGGAQPRDIAVTGDGRHVLVANEGSDTVTVFTADDHGLTRTGSASAPTPVCLLLR